MNDKKVEGFRLIVESSGMKKRPMILNRLIFGEQNISISFNKRLQPIDLDYLMHLNPDQIRQAFMNFHFPNFERKPKFGPPQT